MRKGEKTRERIKQSTYELVQNRGYKSTSIKTVLDAASVKKGTFYFHFQSKEQLIIEVLNEALLRYDEKINSSITHAAMPDQLIDMIEAIDAYHCKIGVSRGCIFGNMGQEMGCTDSDVSVFVGKVFERWVSRFEEMLETAVQNGEMALTESAGELANSILALIQGGLLLAKISNSPTPFDDCKKILISMIRERKTR